MTAVQHILRVIEGDVVKPCLAPTHILDNMRNYCKGIGLFRDGAPKGVLNNIKHDIGAAIVETKGSTQKVSFSVASKVTGFSRRFLASCAEERRLSLEDGVVNLALRERRSDAFMIEYKEFIDAFCHDTNQFTRIDTNRTDGVQIINPFTGKKETHRRKLGQYLEMMNANAIFFWKAATRPHLRNIGAKSIQENRALKLVRDNRDYSGADASFNQQIARVLIILANNFTKQQCHSAAVLQ